MAYGWAGNYLEINLSTGVIERKQSDPKLNEAFLGGKGIGAKLFWDRVPPQAEPFSHDDPLILTTGVLVGTIAPAANHCFISFKSPQTTSFSYSAMGGFLGRELKHAGYDTVVISGKSPIPVYLWIDDDKVEIRDARHLWGKDTFETQRLIREELKNNKVPTVCIGPAGENKVYMASIEHPGTGSSFSQTGPGAVMGDKNLKAIAIYGTTDVNIARPSELMELCSLILDKSKPLKKILEVEGWFDAVFEMGWGAVAFGNADEKPAGLGFENFAKIHRDFLDKNLVREIACSNCPSSCKLMLSRPDGDGMSDYLRCQSFGFSFACKIPDVAFAVKCCDLCTRYGLDVVSTERIIAFVIDLYQKGILTKEDSDGMHLEYGNQELVFTLIRKIAHREGFGNILANGTYETARTIGRGAEKHTHLVKRIDRQTDFFVLSPIDAFVLATCDRGDVHSLTQANYFSFMKKGKGRDTFIKEGGWVYPDEFEKYLDVDYSVDYEGAAELAHYSEDIKTLTDLTGLCWWWTGFIPYPPIKLDTLIELISYVTGMDIDETKALQIASRTRNLIQANQVKLGRRRKDDTVHESLFRREPTRFQKQQLGLVKLNHDKFDKQLDKYYQLKGWNSEGIPLKETLRELGLDYVGQDLEQNGFYESR